MNQTINILRKDLRYLWPESLASLTILSLFTLFEPQSWPVADVGGVPLEGLPAYALAGLLCISWVILIIRLVHAERLVGLNQFWTTRPYEWPKLLAAKALYVLLVVYLPLILCQLFLLHHAHLPILGSVQLLMLNILLLTADLILPTASIAAITGSLAQAALALLGIVVALVTVVAWGVLASSDFSPSLLAPLLGLIEIAMLSALLLHQYRRRATRESVGLFALAAVLVTFIPLLVRGRSVAVFEYALPAQSPISIEFDPNPERTVGTQQDVFRAKQLYLYIPLRLGQMNSGASFDRRAERVTLVGADGYNWRSHWEINNGVFSPPRASATLAIPRQVYERLAKGPASVTMEFAVDQIENEGPLTSTLSTNGNLVSGIGFCYLEEGYGSIRCRSAFREPVRAAFNTFRDEGAKGPCASPSATLDPAHGTIGAGESRVPSKPFLISPVMETPLRLSAPSKLSSLCPGTPITFVEKRLQGRFRVQLPSATIDLQKYVSN